MQQMEYLRKIKEVIDKIEKEQSENIGAAADVCANVINSGKLVHLFGSGHSVLPVQDIFPRYGGVVGFHPCMDPRVMWDNVIGPGGARELLWIERQEGYIENFLQNYNFQKGEAIIVFSVINFLVKSVEDLNPTTLLKPDLSCHSLIDCS